MSYFLSGTKFEPYKRTATEEEKKPMVRSVPLLLMVPVLPDSELVHFRLDVLFKSF